MKLAGISETAAILGVSRQRAHQLAQGEGFPEPVARLAAGPVWKESQIWAWHRKREAARSTEEVSA